LTYRSAKGNINNAFINLLNNKYRLFALNVRDFIINLKIYSSFMNVKTVSFKFVVNAY